VLLELCTFLQSLSDQFAQIVVETQDEYFHFLLNDPRRGTFDTFESRYLETSVVGVGLMYRVLSVAGLFADLREHNFGSQTCTVKITLQDSMFPENNGSTLVQFMDGRATVLETGEADAEIAMDVREFSSLIMGAIDFHALLEYGLATISDERFADRVQALFRTSQRPMCNVHV
jgi:predicted acetyltransferase